MNITIALEQIAENVYLNDDLIMRQLKLDKKTNIMEIKSINPKLKQSEIARELKISTSTLQRYRKETKMFSP